MTTLPTKDKLTKLRLLITENLRIQKYSGDDVPYIDATNSEVLIRAKQNHAIFGRRGCGKTLLLATSSRGLGEDTRVVYLNCEDFKEHSFPNVLIEILDSVMRELESKRRAWFGKKSRAKEIIAQIRNRLEGLRVSEDEIKQAVKTVNTSASSEDEGADGSISLAKGPLKFGISSTGKTSDHRSHTTQSEFVSFKAKITDLNHYLPEIKKLLEEFFELSGHVKVVFLQIDDYYHLKRADQPRVIDYIHRLCKGLPMYFKLATLRHSSTLYAEREGQPIGAQERHDYQPINVDFTFEDFRKTEKQVERIFLEFGRLAGIEPQQMKNLFKGEGFRRLVLAGGGVPRDCLSLFLEVLDEVQDGDGRIGKDDVRILSLSTFERRIEDLKKDSQSDEQDALLKGIHAIRSFCLGNKNNVFCVEEAAIRESPQIRTLIYKLLDYRIIHAVATAITHKTHQGTYRAFAIDIGCYAYLRKHAGKMSETDFSDPKSKDRIRSAPVLAPTTLQTLFDNAPVDVEKELLDTDAG